MMPIPAAVEPLSITFAGAVPFVIATVIVLVGLVSVLSVALADRLAPAVPTSTTTVDRITPRSKVVILPTRERPLAA